MNPLKEGNVRTFFTIAKIICGVAITLCSTRPANAQMLGCLPGQPCPSIPDNELLTSDDYIRSILSHWSPSQVGAWQALEPSFRNWVILIMWGQKQMDDIARRLNQPIGTQFDPNFRLDMPANCSLSTFVEPQRPNDLEYMNQLQSEIPNANWQAWAMIEFSFRTQANKRMNDIHYEIMTVHARLIWWRTNNAAIGACIENNRPRPLNDVQASALVVAQNQSDDQIDRQFEVQKQNVRDTFAPAKVKVEKIHELDELKEMDKYIKDMDRSGKADASPNPHEPSRP